MITGCNRNIGVNSAVDGAAEAKKVAEKEKGGGETVREVVTDIEEEELGLDLALHGEDAYKLDEK